jgi:hypothetical protein
MLRWIFVVALVLVVKGSSQKDCLDDYGGLFCPDEWPISATTTEKIITQKATTTLKSSNSRVFVPEVNCSDLNPVIVKVFVLLGM